MEFLYETIAALDWRQIVMWAIGGILIFLAIKSSKKRIRVDCRAVGPFFTVRSLTRGAAYDRIEASKFATL